MILPAGYASRPAGWDDLDALVALFNAYDRADVGFEEPVREHLEEEWRTQRFDLASSTLMVHAETAPSSRTGRRRASTPSAPWTDSAACIPIIGVAASGAALVDWIEERAAAIGTPKLHNAVPSTDEPANRS